MIPINGGDFQVESFLELDSARINGCRKGPIVEYFDFIEKSVMGSMVLDTLQK